MKAHISKMLKISESDIIDYDNSEKFAIVKIGGVYAVLKMVSLLAPALNEPDYEPSKKEIKKYFPVVIRCSMSLEYAEHLFLALTIDTDYYD